MATAVSFTRRGPNYFAVRFPYDANIVALVKTLPNYARTWEPAAKEWVIDAGHAPALAAHLRECGYTVVGLHDPNVNANNNTKTTWAKDLLIAVGPERADLVHRALTRILHPDNPDGDLALMRDLN